MMTGSTVRMHFVLFGLLYTASFANGQNLAELDRRNGFKSIRLGNPIDSVRGATFKKDFKEKDEFPAKLYEVSAPDYAFVGEVRVKEIQVMTYQNLVYRIVVFTEKDPRVMKALEKSFGKSAYVVRTASYTWFGTTLGLTFQAHKNSFELVYRSYPVIRKMVEDKGKKIDLIAQDF
jgi:hypothetical protein